MSGGMKKLTSVLSLAGASQLSDWGPRYEDCHRMKAIKNVVQN